MREATVSYGPFRLWLGSEASLLPRMKSVTVPPMEWAMTQNVPPCDQVCEQLLPPQSATPLSAWTISCATWPVARDSQSGREPL